MIKNYFQSNLFLLALVFALTGVLVHPGFQAPSDTRCDWASQNSTKILEHDKYDNCGFGFESSYTDPTSTRIEYARGRRHRGPHNPYLTMWHLGCQQIC
jgi:hypothetical protein